MYTVLIYLDSLRNISKYKTILESSYFDILFTVHTKGKSFKNEKCVFQKKLYCGKV